MHDTLRKFGFPATLLHESEHWCLLLRPAQVTLGSMVLVLRDAEPTSLGEISGEAGHQMPKLASAAEKAVKEIFGADKMNYLALMMVDPQVHFHLIPRYSKDTVFNGQAFRDTSWPGQPDFSQKNDVSAATTSKLIAVLRASLLKSLS